MGMIKVGIDLDDADFAKALSWSLAAECKNIMFFLLAEDGDDAQCDLLLTSKERKDRHAVLMVKDRSKENLFDSPPYKVYRYKKSCHLIHDLLFIYFQLTGENYELLGGHKCKVLVFSAVSGGCGCTALALTVGQMLHKIYGQKCLYLNLCPINDAGKYLPQEKEGDFLNLLYYLEEEKDFPLGTFITRTHNIDCIHAGIIHNHFDEMQPKLLYLLMEKIQQSGEYAYLIIDVSNHLSRSNRELMRGADFQVLVSHWQNRLPRPFFSEIRKQFQELVPGKTLCVEMVSVDMEIVEEGIFPISQEKEAVLISDEGFIDLNQLELFQAQAGTIAKMITEEGEGC